MCFITKGHGIIACQKASAEVRKGTQEESGAKFFNGADL